jgi:hypothetical protein
MELSKLAIIGLTVIGLSGVLLAAYAVRRLSIRSVAPTPMQPPRSSEWHEDGKRRTYGDSEIERRRRVEQMQAPIRKAVGQ